MNTSIMKRIALFIAIVAFAAGMANAQVVDTNAMLEQNKLQQQEADQALREQAKEQQRLEKEQARLEKEQAKAEKEQAKAEKERVKAEKAQADAEKKARQEARRAEYGRGLSLNIDPFVGLGVPGSDYSHPYTVSGMADLGAAVSFNYPIRKRTDFTFGIGYTNKAFHFAHHLTCNDSTQFLELQTVTDSLYRGSYINAGYIVVPMRLTFYTRDNKPLNYLGLNLGYCVHNIFYNQMVNSGKLAIADSWNNTKVMNPWCIELVLGTIEKRILFFNAGLQIYYNLAPSFTSDAAGSHKYHEFGLRIQL